jgi:hypothetical protein
MPEEEAEPEAFLASLGATPERAGRRLLEGSSEPVRASNLVDRRQ